MLSKLKENTGWGNNIVALQGYSSKNDYLYKPGAQPNENENIHAVCGKETGMFQISTIARF